MTPTLACLATLPLLLFSLSASAAGTCPRPAVRTTLPDKSVHSFVIADCPGDAQRSIKVLRRQGGKPAQTLLELKQSVEEVPYARVRWIDVDRDGSAELEVRGLCGNGPNCEGDVYRYDPTGRRYHRWFSGGYDQLRLIDGLLVESGRAGCCGWDFTAYRLRADQAPLSEADQALSLSIRAETDHGPRCLFRQRKDGEWRETPAPSAAWRALCKQHLGLDTQAPATPRGGR